MSGGLKKSRGPILRPAGAVPGGSGEVPGSSREALGDCGRLQESPEGSREAPGSSGEALGADKKGPGWRNSKARARPRADPGNP